MNVATVVPVILSAISQAGAFEAGSPITLNLPEESIVIDLPQIGKVSVTETGTSIVIHKA